MTDRAAGTIDFEYDEANDVVIATPHWSIESEEDVRTWYSQYVAYFSRYGRPMDVVFVLDDFALKPALGVYWGEHRAKMQQQFTRFSYRIHSPYSVRLFVHTSGSRHNVATHEAESLEDALACIHAARRAAGLE